MTKRAALLSWVTGVVVVVAACRGPRVGEFVSDAGPGTSLGRDDAGMRASGGRSAARDAGNATAGNPQTENAAGDGGRPSSGGEAGEGGASGRSGSSAMGEAGATATSSGGERTTDGGASGRFDGGLVEPEPTDDAGVSERRGPELVPVPGYGFSIDATEVTRGQYQSFLDGSPSVLEQERRCSEHNGSFVPYEEWPPEPDLLDHPVVGVDWCDAYAFCSWAGKRLCGHVEGGGLDHDSFDDASQSQWYAACSLGGLRNYPYGDVFDDEACNGWGSRVPGNATVPVASLPECRAAELEIYDMSGNVAEWEDACTDSVDPGASLNPAQEECRVRGGGFPENDGSYLRCQGGVRTVLWRDRASNSIGFRCCSAE